MKRWIAWIAAVITAVMMPLTVCAADIRYEFEAEEGETIASPSAMLMYLGVRAEQDVLLYEKDADTAYQPGALTRVAMLGYAMKLVEEKQLDLDESTGTFTLYLYNHYVTGTGLAIANMGTGEEWTLRDLFSVCAIQTAADSAVTLAAALSGTVEAFVDGLNAFAAELGCTGSHFTNVTGLNDEGQYMTPRDVMTFTRYAMQYSVLKEMMSLTQYTVNPVKKGKKTSWPTANDMVRASSPYYYAYAHGGKTGGTLTELGVVQFGGKDGYEYLAVVMGAPKKDEKGNPTGTAYADIRRLLRWGILDFEYCILAHKSEPVARIPLRGSAKKDSIQLVPTADLATVIAEDIDQSKLVRKVTYTVDSLTAPVEKGQVVGRLEIYYEDALVGAVDLQTGETAEYQFLYTLWLKIASWFSGWRFWLMVVILAALIGGYAVLNVAYNRKKRTKTRR